MGGRGGMAAVKLDRADKAALSRLLSYTLLFLLVLVGLLALAVVAGAALHLFLWAAGG
jgi:hypothetical protein